MMNRSSSCYGRTYSFSHAQSQMNKRAGLKRNIIISVSGLILLLGILSIGVTITHNHDKRSQSAKSISVPGSMAFQHACGSTRSCMQHLSESLAGNPLHPVVTIAEAALSHVNQAWSLTKTLSAQHGNGLENAAVEDCLEQLDNARDQLTKSIFQLSSLSLRGLARQLVDVKMWLSTALSYQSTCAEGFYNQKGSITNQMLMKQADVSNVVTNALYLVDQLSRLRNFFPPIHRPIHRRKLLSEKKNSVDCLPQWVSPADRKLLQAPPPSSSGFPSSGFDALVAADGSGQFNMIQDAVNNIPHGYEGRYVIYIKKGVYDEIVTVSKHLQNITFLGDGIDKTIITGDRNVATQQYTTFRSATVAISGQGFIARDITFRNTAGPSGHQAVALRAGADYVVFDNCKFDGYQDTLYALSSRQFFRNCMIYGTVDFIFGNAAAIFQNCRLLARQPLKGQQNTYTAHGRKVGVDPTGFSFQNCTVTAADDLKTSNYTVPTFLGRPWKAYSRAVFMNSYLDSLINPAGWLAWNESNPFEDTVYYGEYKNTGPASDTSARVNWPGVHSRMSFQDALPFNVDNLISGTTWLPDARVEF